MYIASYSYRCINTQNTNMHIAMPNRNYTTVCILSLIMLSVYCHSVNIAPLFQHHV